MSTKTISKKGDTERNPTQIRHLKKVEQSEKADIFGQLTPKQEAFVEAYLESDFIYQAANMAGVGERTARRWLTESAIQAAIAQLRQERREVRENRLIQCMDYATTVVDDVLYLAANPDEAKKEERRVPEPDRVDKYVAMMMKYALDQREIDALKLRIIQLEAELAKKSPE